MYNFILFSLFTRTYIIDQMQFRPDNFLIRGEERGEGNWETAFCSVSFVVELLYWIGLSMGWTQAVFVLLGGC